MSKPKTYFSPLKRCERCGNTKPPESFARSESRMTDECKRCRDKRKGIKPRSTTAVAVRGMSRETRW